MRRETKGLWVALPTACVLLGLLTLDKYKALRQEKLIVYSNGRNSLVEIIRGQKFAPVFGAGAENYNAKATRIGWHAWKERTTGVGGPYLNIRGKRVLVLSDSSQNRYTSPLPVDVLIIARPLRQMRVGSVLESFDPKEVVLAQRPSAYHLQRWKDSCAARGVYLCNVNEQGAYILE